MLRPNRTSARLVSLAKVLARVVVAVCLALSFFASLLPLRVSADASEGAMACCVGKAGHCNSGLIAKRQAKPKPKPEPMCGLQPAAENANDDPVADDEIAGDITADDLAAETTNDGITVLAASSEVKDQRDTRPQRAAETSPNDATTSASVNTASLTKPCPADCRAGTTGVVRQPRPREIALLAKGSRRILPAQASWKSRPFKTNLAASAVFKRTSPRGPPLSS